MRARIRSRVDRQELEVALARILLRLRRRRGRIRCWRRRVSAYASSCVLEHLTAEWRGFAPLRLVFKDLSPASLLPIARRIRPRFLYDPGREIEVYRSILPQLRLNTPRCYGAVADPDRGRFWLFLERVEGPLLWQRGRLETWREAARWLARLHSLGAEGGRLGELAGGGRLLTHDAAFYRLWLERAEAFVRREPVATDADSRRRFRRLARAYDRVIGRLTELPRTLIHGEFGPSNVILRAGSRGSVICPIDWECAAFGPGVIDLAMLTSGDWRESDRQTMLEAYRGAVEPGSSSVLRPGDLAEAVRFARLHVAIQWLGWAPDWLPPRAHARNWLAEALQLAKDLGL